MRIAPVAQCVFPFERQYQAVNPFYIDGNDLCRAVFCHFATVIENGVGPDRIFITNLETNGFIALIGRIQPHDRIELIGIPVQLEHDFGYRLTAEPSLIGYTVDDDRCVVEGLVDLGSIAEAQM